MEKITGWFPQTNYETLDKLIKEHNIKTVIEIGAFVGLSTVFFAERVDQVITIEPFNALENCDYLHGKYKEAAKDQYNNFIKNTAHFNNIIVIPVTSEEAVNEVPESSVADLIYIDGSHKYADVKKDIEMWLPRANKILCGDDYTKSWPGVRKAVDECGQEVNKNQRVWFIIK